jgi:hypothetical protein
MDMARFADHSGNQAVGGQWVNATDDDIKRMYQRLSYDFDHIVEEARDPSRPVMSTENMLGSTWQMTNDENTETIITSSYEHAFSTAVDHLDRAVSDASFSALQSAVVHGIASIEAFVNYRAGVWNEANPATQLIDSKQQKVSFDDKIDEWIPLMTGGVKLDKGNEHWQEFKRLQALRDNATIHIKDQRLTVSHAELAELINAFSSGIAGLQFDLHILCKNIVPSAIIRARYAPPCEVVSR